MKKHAKRNNILFITFSIIILILIGVTYYYTTKQLIFDESGLTYTNYSSFANYNITHKSNFNLGEYVIGDTNYNNDISLFGNDIYFSKTTYGAYPVIILSEAYSNNMNINFSNIESISFNINFKSELAGCNDRSTNGASGGTSKLYLVNKAHTQENLLYEGPITSSGLDGAYLYEINKKITIFKNLDDFIIDVAGTRNTLNISNYLYELLMYSTTSTFACEEIVSENQKIELSNLNITYKNISQCYPKTCSELNKQCGFQDNGCGTVISCGTCSEGFECNNSGQCKLIPVINKSNYYRLSNNCSIILLYPNETTSNDYVNQIECLNNVVNNTVYNCTYYNNCSTPSNNTNQTNLTTCWKVREFLKQTVLPENSPCYSYEKSGLCINPDYSTRTECETEYYWEPWYIKLWQNYGFIFSITIGLVSLIVSILYLFKYFNKKK